MKLLKPKGQLAVIHRADRLADLLAALKGRGVGAVRILPLWPKPGRPAGRVIVLARKGSRAPLDLLRAIRRTGETAEPPDGFRDPSAPLGPAVLPAKAKTA